MTIETAIPEAVRKIAEADEARELADIEAQKKRRDPAEAVPGEAPAEIPPETAAEGEQPAKPEVTPDSRLATLEQDLERERQRNRTLQAMMAKQGPEMAETIRELKAELEDLKRANEKPAVPEVEARLKYLNDEEREMWKGEKESVEVRMAKGIADEAIAAERKKRQELEERLARLEQGQRQDKAEATSSVLWDEVEKALPGARAINNTPRFDDWLNGVDPRSMKRLPYRVRGEHLVDVGDAQGLADFLKEYVDAFPEVSADLRAQIKPSKSGVVEARAKSTAKPMIPESEVAAFYNDKARGRLRHADGRKMSEEEAAKVEKEIESAMEEGRIKPG